MMEAREEEERERERERRIREIDQVPSGKAESLAK